MCRLVEYQQFLKDIANANRGTLDTLFVKLHSAMLACDAEKWHEVASIIIGKYLVQDEGDWDDIPILMPPHESYVVKAHITSIRKGKLRFCEEDLAILRGDKDA